MTQKIIELAKNTRVVIKNVAGDFSLKGWNRTELRLQNCTEDDKVEQEENIFFLTCSNNSIVELPHSLPVEIGSISGDASVISLTGVLQLGAVGADLSIQDVGVVTVETVGGDFSAHRVRDALTIKSVGGDCVAEEVNGQFSVQQTGGDLIVNGIQGNMTAKSVSGDCIAKDLSRQFSAQSIGGDLHLKDIVGGIETSVGGDANAAFSPVPWQAYVIQAGGNIHAQIPEDANAEFDLKSKAKKIQIDLKENKEIVQDETYHLLYGEGGPSVSLEAAGKIVVTNQGTKRFPDLEENFAFTAGMGEMAEEIAQQTIRQIESQLGILEENLHTQLSGLSEGLAKTGLSDEKAHEVQERITKAQERARRKAQLAQKKLERKIMQTQRKAVRHARKERREAKEIDVEALLSNKSQAAKVASDEERIMILKMLQEKKITAAQADDLLSVLEGRS